jgi:hypothetical protein
MTSVALGLAAVAMVAVATLTEPQAQPQSRAAGGAQTRAKPAPADRAVPFRVGETLDFDVAWSSFLTAGTATLSVRGTRTVGTSTAYHLHADGRAVGIVARLYHVYYRAESLLDTRTRLPHEASLYREEGRRRRTNTTKFDRGARRVFFEASGDGSQRVDLPMPADAHDPLSALFAIRTLPMRAKATTVLTVASNEKLYRVRVTVHGRETITTPLGARAAWRLSPAIEQTDVEGGEPRRIALWVSDDAQRLPLRMEADMPVGTFNLVLRQTGNAGGVD